MVRRGDFKVCNTLQGYHLYLQLILQIPVAALCMVRIYALYNQDRRVLWALVALAVILLALACYFALSFHDPAVQVYSLVVPLCAQLLSDIGGRRLALAWSSALIFDSAVFGLTVYQALRIGRQERIVHVLLRDGAMYFLALFSVNLASILTLLLAPVCHIRSNRAYAHLHSH
ncbi:hypothetical protein OF83DRAFT_1110403 [Amylostereum chailletii]|nr:hypothetical protein OF83DRAFT_1110403 [Amylostereum chailletii]